LEKLIDDKTPFIIYPAIDLRGGQVVRLQQGDPDRQTIYTSDPAAATRRWLEAGATWLHIVNLDGAFGENQESNQQALAAILKVAREHGGRVQMGGGLRSLEGVAQALQMGVARAVIGTLAIEQPGVLASCIERFGPQRIAVGIDARDGLVQVRGWKTGSQVKAVDLAVQMARIGVQWIIFTDVSRDGVGKGLNMTATLEMAQVSRINVIASGGVDSPADLRAARDAGLAGVIVGRALYERRLTFQKWVEQRK
jgi:phosphoribosylformimino-5-aminoimidazole carboxamide ribotide isomerase